MSEPEVKSVPNRESFAAISPLHAKFADAGGYDALRTLHDLCNEMRVPYVSLVELGTENHAAGFVPDSACVEVQAASLAARGCLEDLVSGLAAYLAIPVGPNGDGDVTPTEGG